MIRKKKITHICGMALLALVFSAHVSARDLALKLHLRGVYDSKVSLMPLAGPNALKPVVSVEEVKNGKEAILSIPGNLLPGEFVLRFDYRQKESDSPYPAEKQVILNREDAELWVNPLYGNNPDSTWWNKDEKENTAFVRFAGENARRKQKVAVLQNFLMSYDDTQSRFFELGVEEYEKRRGEYNRWLTEQADLYSSLFVGHTFRFQYVPQVSFGGSPNEKMQEVISHYFDGVNLKDSLLIYSKSMAEWMNGYVNLYGQQAATTHLRDSLFTLAGQRAIEKAKTGHPKVYGWMVDYFYKGYESFNITKGTAMLQQYIDDPNCLTTRRQEILKRFEGMQKMKIGSVASGFDAEMFDGMKLRFDGVSKQKNYELIVFYESDCSHCKELLKELATWYRVPQNKVWFDIITVALDDNRKTWEENYQKNKFEWHDVWVEGGVNSKVANDYYILSTPVVYIVDKDMKVAAMPNSVKEIEKFLNE